MPSATELVENVRHKIGIDAYRYYSDSKHAITETVLVGIATACILQYLRGYVDFEKIGKQNSARVKAMIENWRKRSGLERVSDKKLIRASMAAALEMIPPIPTPDERASATTLLEEALREFGLPEKLAHERAKEIDALVQDHISKSTGQK